MAALDAITQALLQEVKANQEEQEQLQNRQDPEHSITNEKNEDAVIDDNEPKLLRIIIYESNV